MKGARGGGLRLRLLTSIVLLLLLAALAFFAARAVANEEARHRQELSLEYEKRLSAIVSELDREVRRFEEQLLTEMLEIDLGDREAMRRLSRESGRIRQLFLLSSDGRLLFPPEENRGQREAAFLDRAGFLAESGTGFALLPEARAANRGWYLYYEADTTAYIFWYRLDDGSILGADIFREALLADLFIALSFLDSSGRDSSGREGDRIAVKDELGRALFLSGSLDPDEDGIKPLVSSFPADPLQGWRIDAFLDPHLLSPPGPALSFILIGALLVIALGSSGFLLWRETGREIREAGRRVGFVSRVSHELKSPITNIRLYGELILQRSTDEKVRHHGEVILQESERLSRLVNNVLTFSGGPRRLRYEKVRPQILIKEIFDNSDLELRFAAMVDDEILIDRDTLQQILVNLLSNAEKYAAPGKRVEIESRIDEKLPLLLHLYFRDFGPGIPKSKREAVFAPFYRLRDDLVEGVSGSGLGLAIARDLARSHGGDLVIEPVKEGEGTLFHLTLKTGASHEDTDS